MSGGCRCHSLPTVELTVLHKSLSWIFEARNERGKGEDGTDGRITFRNKFLFTSFVMDLLTTTLRVVR